LVAGERLTEKAPGDFRRQGLRFHQIKSLAVTYLDEHGMARLAVGKKRHGLIKGG
jgi:hypothetical protein